MTDKANSFSPTSPFDWGKNLPGMDFLKQLQASAIPNTGNAASAAGGLGAVAGGWAVPTLNVQELEQRIKDLESVLFWLEQNVMGVKTTIQALQVQKMTLSTLQDLNVNFQDLATQLQQGMSAAVQPQAEKPTQPASSAAKESTTTDQGTVDQTDSAPEGSSAINPALWWNALTEQFQKVWEQAAVPADTAKEEKRSAGSKSKQPAPAPRSAQSSDRRQAASPIANLKSSMPSKKRSLATRNKPSVKG